MIFVEATARIEPEELYFGDMVNPHILCVAWGGRGLGHKPTSQDILLCKFISSLESQR